jgi:thiamine monophosphate kinase
LRNVRVRYHRGDVARLEVAVAGIAPLCEPQTREDLVMHFGGDYELLFTFSPDAVDELSAALGGRLHVIGRVKGEQNVLITAGKVVPLDTRGYEHFRS